MPETTRCGDRCQPLHQEHPRDEAMLACERETGAWLNAYDRDVTTTRDEALTDLERAGHLVEQRVSADGSFDGSSTK